MPDRDVQTKSLLHLALVAGREIMTIYQGDFTARTKDDLSPVTEADEIAEHIILAGLAELDPETPVISEEAAAAGRIPHVGQRFYLVDPLDGTKEFVSHNGEFTVNIALIEHGAPVMGVVYAPAIGRLFFGHVQTGAFEAQIADGQLGPLSPIHVRPPPSHGLTVVASRSHKDIEMDIFLKNFNVERIVTAGSSLKFCLLAAAEADLYPRFGRTMEWDTAAGHAVLLAAGGSVTRPDGKPLTYGKRERGFDNPGFIASGKLFRKH